MSDLGTLAMIAEQVGGRVIGDAQIRVARVAALDDADEMTLTFATDERYLRDALVSHAAAILVAAALIDETASYAKPLLAVESPRMALAAILRAVERPRPRGPFVHPSAVVDPTATLGADVYVGPHVTIGAGAAIGARTVLGAGVVVGVDARIGQDGTLHAHVYVADGCIAGDRVVLQAQAVIGADGFGWALVDGALQKIPQVGIVELADDVEVGANSCIDRAQTGVTSVGCGTKIDNLCQVGHNCRIGMHCAIAAQCGFAGTTTLGDYVQVGGQAGFGGHLTVGSGAKVAAGAKVWADVPAGETVSGEPARKHRDNIRLQAYIRRLPKLFDRVDIIERNDSSRRD